MDCIECGCCDLVCPSHISLTAEFRQAKARMQELADEKARAERARQRFEARTKRLEEEALARQEELAAQKTQAKNVSAEDLKAILRRAEGGKSDEKSSESGDGAE